MGNFYYIKDSAQRCCVKHNIKQSAAVTYLVAITASRVSE